jgi:predicted nucleotide-binding protein
MVESKEILWIDDDTFYARSYAKALESQNYDVHFARTLTEAMSILNRYQIDLVITDIMMMVLPKETKEFNPIETKGGHETGVVLARWVKKRFPGTQVIGLTSNLTPHLTEAFLQYGDDIQKKETLSDPKKMASYINSRFNLASPNERLKTLIIHGHDEAAKYELKNFIQNTLKWREPIILHEQPSRGRTIIEKFEEEAKDIDAVFALLTPDDQTYHPSAPDEAKRRARQNVIFELGYFMAKLQRTQGRVLLLYKGQLELPSDISGLAYIDISNGIESAGETIRRELHHLLQS